LDPHFEVLESLPSTGPLPRWVPESWQRTGGEGFVVRFLPRSAAAWVANFRPSGSDYRGIYTHPDGQHLLVFAGGDTYLVDPESESVTFWAELFVTGAWQLEDSADLLVETSGVAFARIGAAGIAWRTRNLSWDGFHNVRLSADRVWGQAWSPITEGEHPFSVHLESGRATGGAPDDPESSRYD
jgi:hypothetical protein